ncbi:hypothetical protein A9Q84_16525 [Halobacteriovorax marinus]|uniref:Protein-glutamate methylesterase/protein-glutamine glutaminase n=1 Tax=Halobacteriovorax marinus TaxID=97084 RepID=A0A1Y5F553_9BACT|nr:hypothetical protein A9Q84_16525 [Halobacteriovorax marinus]
MSTSKITHVKKVIVVDDSLPVQKVIKRCLKDDSDIKVVSTASSAMEALEQIKIYKPDVITLDIQMPEMTGIEFLKKYAKELDIAVIIVSSFSKDDSDYYFQSLELGAFEYIEKPSFDSLDEISKKLCRTIKSSKKIREVLSLKNIKIVKVKKHHISKIENNIVVIGSSTGGVEALKEIFNSYPCEIPPTIVIQHIPESFSMKLAARFNELYEFTVKEAEHNETILKNTIYIAPGGKQLKIVKTGSVIKLFVTDDPPFNRHKPSVDFFFNSIANINEFDKHVVACILTGMGEDGARGLLRLKNNGFSTIAQDEESSVVFGMPRAAIKLNAAKYILPLKKIALMTFNKLK